MRVQTSLPAIWRESLRASAEGLRAPGKASESGTSSSEQRDPSRDMRRARPCLQVEIVSHAETKAHDPFWDGPRLVPAFVTQLLGQVMEPCERPAPRRVCRVYGETGTGAAVIFDARF